MKRIGIIGLGYIGQELTRRVIDADDMEVAFLWNRSAKSLTLFDDHFRLKDLSRARDRRADLIVEAAHPAITRQYGRQFLAFADYLPLSVSVLADDELRRQLLDAADQSGRTLFVPAGALMGIDALHNGRDIWDKVRITFRKHPDNIDFSESGFDPNQIRGETLLYKGPVRGIAPLYPRNINTMITCALATIGLDRCTARLIADPCLEVVIAEVEAVGRDGSMLRMSKQQPVVGVSGTEMVSSIMASLRQTMSARDPLTFV